MIQNSRGDTLVTVMIAVAVGGIVSLAMMSIMSQMSAAQTSLLAVQDAMMVTDQARTIFQADTSCMAAIGTGVTYDASGTKQPLTLTNVNLGTGPIATVPAAGVVVPNTKVAVKVGYQSGALLSSGPGGNSYQGSITLDFTKTSGTVGGSDLRTRLVSVVFSTNAANKISSCSATAAVGGCRMCKSCGGSWPVNAGLISAHNRDWSSDNHLGASCAGGMYQTLHEPPSLCCAN